MSAFLQAVTTTTYPNPFAGSSGGGVTQLGSSGGGISAPYVTNSGSSGFDFFGGVALELLAFVLILALFGVLVIIVVANRADPDASGRRPRAVYYFFVSFVTVITAVFGSVGAVWSLFRLVGSHTAPLGDDIARALVLGGLVTVVSLGLLASHLQRGLELSRAGADGADPSRRVAQSYVSAISFVFILIVLFTTIISVYLVFALAGPGVFGSFGGRSDAFRDLLDAVYLLLLAVLVLRRHRNMVPPGLWSTAPVTGPGVGSASPTL